MTGTAEMHVVTAHNGQIFVLPASVGRRIADFLLDKKTGNIKINVKDGQILGLHIEGIYPVRTDYLNR